ncbi:MAG: peptidase MA family metallohydrolase, partial [Polyangiaceae bacterium]
MKRLSRTLLGIGVVLAFATGVDVRPTNAQLGPNLGRASDAITEMDFDDAHHELDGADTGDVNVALQVGRLALYETRFDDAVTMLSRPDVARSEAGAQAADIARGCARVAAATIVERDEARGIEIRFQDENDRAMAPVLVETVEKARASLERDLGVTWPRPMRIVVVRDLLSLAITTGLPYESAKTTGTVAVAKWGRVTLLSPRATKHGYAWRDTVAHELTHLAVTRLTTDRAPLWLQEGIAKREEIRWRDPDPFDDRPTPEAIVARGASQHLDTPLDKLGPSIAMLPSADKAAVAFAEVTSFVRFYADTVGPSALPSLLSTIRLRDNANLALTELTGTDLAGWDTRWRAYLAARPVEPLPEAWSLGAVPPGLHDIQNRARL